MRRSLTPLLPLAYLLILSGLTGCPPTGDPPPFAPALGQDRGVLDGALDEGRLPDVFRPQDAAPDRGPPPGCVDSDNDGYVEAIGCPLPPGDCAPSDPSRNPGVVERCNLQDDNCNGQIDENDPEGGEACETTLPGICREGRTACVQGSVECKQVRQALPAEACNNIDDNCNGQIDEGNPEGGADCDTGQPGLCAAGMERCQEGALRCVSGYVSTAEICNGEDDNCDGDVDEGDPEGGAACDTGLDGVCAIGEARCQGGGLACAATQSPTAERCDGRDDDCNGVIDDPWQAELGQPCVVGQGACAREGLYACAEDGRGVACQATPGAGSEERCNDIDDDCDGDVDEGFGLGVACTVGVGVCEAEGLTVCAEDALGVTCEGTPGLPRVERCNDLDDNCNGDVDEGFPDKGQPCDAGVGECNRAGLWVCAVDGGLRCDAVAAPPTDELCNELDDDCDTLIDEDFPDKGQPCEVGVGECLRVGERVCDLDGGLSCGVDPGPAIDELCDGLDNDCDGRLDNGAPCQGPPMGRVTSMRVEEFIAPEGCRDFDEDGQPDNALGAVAGLLNGPLNASLLDGQRVLYLQALDAHLAVMEGDAEGPIWRAFNAAGLPRGLMPTQWEAGQITSTLPLAALPLMAPTFYDRAAAEALSLLPLYEAIVLGGLAEVEGGLRAEALRFTGYFNRAELLNAYAAAERACFGQRRFECPDGSVIEAARWCDEIIDCPGFTDEDSLGCVASLFTCGDVELPRAALCDGVADCADGEDEALPFCPPAQALPGCAIFDDAPLDILSANLEADLDLNGDGDFEAVSACLLLSLEPQASLPQGGQTCVDDSDCYAGLRCRPMPVDEGDGLRLIRRCERPVGRGALGEACAVDEDCAHGLCLRYTASGGVCSALCGADAECFEGARCRGLPSPLTAADTVGGRTMRACLPTSGSQAPCDHTCPGSEVCAIYFDEGAGDPTAWVGAVGHCEAPHPEGAALGAVCEVAWGCAHGGGCASVGEALACLQPCALPGSCAQGQVCMDQPLMGEVAVMHPACVPLLDGSSGLPCQGGLDCPGGERCAPFYLSGAQAVERACVRGEGFYSVGTRCQADGECASGVCLQYCADLCSINEDCGASLGCHEDAYLDDEGRALGGLCGPAALACQSDNDCRQDPTCCDEDDPSCLSLRCVCDARRCRIGCRVGGSCPTGLVCLDDGRCALYCRDDADEAGGNDLLEDATLLPLGREAPIHTRVGHLCAASPVDWYGFNHPGVAPYRLEISQVEGEAILMEVEIFDAFGRLLRRLEPVDGGFVYEQTREEALASQGQLIYFRVRATGFERGASYNLSVDLSALVEDCLDPDPEEPRDAHWQPYEIGAQPALNPIEVVEGRLCPLDEDWYKLWVGNGDTLSVTLERLDEADPQPGSVEVFLIGPDHPDLESAQTLSQLNDSGEMIYSPPSMTCDSAATRNCKFDDGLVTRMFCYNDLNCTGAPYSLRVRSDRPLSEIPYRLTFDIQRAEAPLCVADLYEQNHAYMDMRRYHGAMAPELRVLEQGTIINGSGVGEWATLPYNTPVRMEMRACGAENAYADSIADRDSISLWMNEDEAFEVVIDQRGGQSQDLKLNIIQWTGTNVTVQRTYNFSDAHYVQRYTAPLESVYGVVIDRQKNTAQPNPSYVYDLAYDLTLTRVPASSVVEQDCDALGTSVNFVFGNSSTVAGSTLGHRDDHQPLDCEGGDGPDRVYAVDLPANQFGRLDATVVAQDGSDPAISIRTDCAVAFSEQACNEDDLSAAHPDRQAHASALFQGGQRVYVIVDSYDADSAGAFLLTLQWTRQ